MMNDLEIEIAVAKIYLGKEFDIHTTTLTGKCGYLPANCIGKLTIFNPLTDDALCFQLMIKYKVTARWLWGEINGTPHYEAYINEDYSDIKYSKSPNKAICLAIIEAHKENK